MFVLGEVFNSLALLINLVCTVFYWLLIARIIVSWLAVDPYNNIVQFIVQTTEPILRPLRRLPLQLGMLDLSPLVAFVAIQFVNSLAVGILRQLADRMGA